MKGLKGLFLKLIIYSFVFICTFPLVLLALWSFTKRWPWPYLLPKEFTLRSYAYFLDQNCFKVLCFSILLSFIVTVITLLLSIPAGKALGLYNFKGKSFFKMLVLSPIVIPTAAIAMGAHIAFIKLGLANSIAGVVVIHLLPCLPYGIIILSDVYELIGEKIEVQARVLGAKPYQVMMHVTMPLLAPGIITAGSLIFIISLSQYFLTFLIGGGNVLTFSIYMVPFIQSGDRTMAAAFGMIFIAATLSFLALMEKLVKSYYKTEKFFYL